MVNQQTGNRLDTAELGSVLQALARSGRCRISSFPSARRRQPAGSRPQPVERSRPARQIDWWRPLRQLRKAVTQGQWQEADLNYKGGKRGANRLVFSRAGQRFVSVDHYQRFIEVPACQ
jgi:hypothetical protein